MDFSYQSRMEAIKKMPDEKYDVLIIGGGITGCGIALDAVLRGLKVALVERGDFASGTSSRSTKLVHGGLRYLAKGEVNLVKEAGTERNALLNIAPHIVTPMPFIIPTAHKLRGAMSYYPMTIGLWMYDKLANVRPHERRVMLKPEQVVQLEPLLTGNDLAGGGRYYEYVTDDARLTLEVAKTAHEHGGQLLNYVEVTDLLVTDGQCKGAHVRDVLSGTRWTVHAATVVNAAGPWVDDIRRKDVEPPSGKHLFHSKGIHLVLDRATLPVSQAVTLQPSDGRIVFVIPRERYTYVGTTDTEYNGDLHDLYPTRDDVDYLIGVLNEGFPSCTFNRNDVISTWTGVRPLIYEEGKKAGEISRSDEMMTSQTGLISIAGGKLTAYRKMAERVVDHVVETLQKQGVVQHAKPCETLSTPLTGVKGISHQYEAFLLEKAAELRERGFDDETAKRWVRTYGRHTDRVVQLHDENGDQERLHRDLLAADVRFAVKHEQVLTVCDVLERRHSLFLFSHDQGRSAIDPVARIMAEMLGWSNERMATEIAQAKESIARRNRWMNEKTPTGEKDHEKSSTDREPILLK